ncbi:MAG: hypothetical protein QXN56_06120, partial [Candidatus Hadarchaeum sp.]
MASQQYSNDKETKERNTEVASDDALSSGWPTLQSYIVGTTPQPSQGPPMDRAEQMAEAASLPEKQGHDSGEGIDTFPGGHSSVTEEPPAPAEAEPRVVISETGLSTPSEEPATSEAAGPLLQEAPPEIPTPTSSAPSEVERSSAVSSPELQALLELQELGLIEIEGEPIANLISLARSRAQALDRLAEARKCFAEGMDGNETLVQQAVQDAQAALRALEEIRYPEGETFSARRVALAGDLAQVRALLAALDTWWWQRFAQALAEVYALFKTPQQAQQSLTRAKTLLARWPDFENSIKLKAQGALETAQREMEEGLVERQFRALLDEAEAWVALANASTDEAAVGQAEDGTLALEYIMRAEAALKAAERLWDRDLRAQRRNLLSPSLNNTRSNIAQARNRCLSTFPQAVLKRRRDVLASEISRWLEDYTGAVQAVGTEDGDRRYLFISSDEQARHLRRRLDDLIELIRLDPDYMPDEAIRDLIRRREENRRRSAELVGEAQRVWKWANTASHDAETRPNAELFVYRVWRLLEEAKKLDPDLETNDGEIKQLFSSVRQEWSQLQQQINDLFNKIEGAQRQLNQKFSELENINITDLKNSLKTIEEDLNKLKRRLSRHLETPLNWHETINILEQQHHEQKARADGIADTLQRVQGLVEAWKTPHNLPRLIEETQALCCSDMLPAWIRRAAVTAVREAVRQALPEIRRRRPPLP